MVKSTDDLIGGEGKELKSKYNVYLGGEDIHTIEELMKLGVGPDLSNVVKKGIKVLYLLSKSGELASALKSSSQGQNIQTDKESKDPFEIAIDRMAKAKTMKQLSEDDSPSLKDILTFMIIKEAMKPQQQQDPAIAALREEISALKNALQQMAETKKYEELKESVEKIAEKSKSSELDKMYEFMREMEKQREELRAELEKARMEMIRSYLDNELAEIKSRIQSASTESELQKLKTYIDTIKELSSHIGTGGTKTDKELMADIIKAGLPVLKDVGAALAKKREEEALRQQLAQEYLLAQQMAQRSSVPVQSAKEDLVQLQDTQQSSIQPQTTQNYNVIKQTEQHPSEIYKTKLKKEIDELLAGRIGSA